MNIYNYCTWENFGGEKLANLVNYGLFINILLANYFFIELQLLKHEMLTF